MQRRRQRRRHAMRGDALPLLAWRTDILLLVLLMTATLTPLLLLTTMTTPPLLLLLLLPLPLLLLLLLLLPLLLTPLPLLLLLARVPRAGGRRGLGVRPADVQHAGRTGTRLKLQVQADGITVLQNLHYRTHPVRSTLDAVVYDRSRWTCRGRARARLGWRRCWCSGLREGALAWEREIGQHACAREVLFRVCWDFIASVCCGACTARFDGAATTAGVVAGVFAEGGDGGQLLRGQGERA